MEKLGIHGQRERVAGPTEQWPPTTPCAWRRPRQRATARRRPVSRLRLAWPQPHLKAPENAVVRRRVLAPLRQARPPSSRPATEHLRPPPPIFSPRMQRAICDEPGPWARQ
eukprot:1419028-Alexandrium_andersonii.AAC.1